MTTTVGRRYAATTDRGGALTGYGPVLRLAIRRDRILVAVTLLALAILVGASAATTVELYPDPAEAIRDARAVTNSPATIALYGPLSGETVGSLATFKVLLMGAVAVGFLALALVRRHTRGDEEAGRLELLGSGVMGRRVPLAVGVTVASGAVALSALVAAGALVATGLPRCRLRGLRRDLARRRAGHRRGGRAGGAADGHEPRDDGHRGVVARGGLPRPGHR
ncbi:hypothetical protein [Janibacter sp. G1551]|uniref:hypothetical protein n=1 Tax=Janibacter sp. G1551 TaxID=3420440 RepID=UPI003CFFD992